MTETAKELTDSLQNFTILSDLLSGMSVTAIAEKHDVSRPTIYARLRKEDFKTILDQIQAANVIHATEINQKHLDICLDDEHKNQFDGIRLFMKNTGITPSKAQSVFINQLYQNNAIEGLGQVLSLMQAKSANQDDIFELPESAFNDV